MNLTVKLKALKYIVDLVSTVTPTRTTLPSLSAVLLAYDDCRLTACATDLRSFARAHCEAIGEQSGAFGVRADLLGIFLSMCSDEEVEIEVGKRAKFRCGKRETTLAVLVPDEFKAHPEVDGVSFEFGGQKLHDAIAMVTHAAMEEGNEAFPERASVAFDFGPTLDILSLNGRQIAITSFTESGTGVYLVPTFLSNQIKRALSDPDDTVKITLNERAIKVESPRWSLSGPLFNGNYPTWRKSLPFLFDATMPQRKFQRTQFADAVKMCLPYGEMGWARVHLKGDGESATIETVGQDDTRSIIEMAGEPIDVFFQGKEMIGLLNSLNGDTVTLEYRDEKGVGIVVHEDNFTAAIMPLGK